MINIAQLRIGNFCYANKKSGESDFSNALGRLSALDKIRAQVRRRDKIIYQVASINRTDTIELSNSFNEDILTIQTEEIYPIELNPDILHNCGFKEKTFTSKDWNEKYLTIEGDIPIRVSEFVQHSHYPIYVFDKQTQSNTFLRNINYLHQLQNLYFELTGRNLKVDISFMKESPILR